MLAHPDPAELLPTPRPRRWRRWLLLLALAVAALVAAGPTIASFGPIKALAVRRINARLAPGSVVIDRWSLGWLAPARIHGLALVTPSGKQVIAAQEVRASWGLLGLIMAQPDLGTITVEGAKIDVERRVDGTIDILDALGRAGGKPDPSHPTDPDGDTMSIRVVIQGGTLRAASPELADPVAAGNLDATVVIAPGKPLTLAATLTDGTRSVRLEAAVERPAPIVPDDVPTQASAAAGSSDLTLRVVGRDWPLTCRGDGGIGRGRFEGKLEVQRIKGLWAASTVGALADFEADGPAWQGDHPKFDRVTLLAEAAQQPAGAGWSVAQFELACPIGRFHANGALPPVEGTPTQLRVQVELVGLTRLLPHTLHLHDGLTVDRGTATLAADLTGGKGAERATVDASVADFAATRDGRAVIVHEFPRLTAVATRQGSKVTVERLEVKATGVDITASGDLDAGVNLKGTVDLAALDAQARDFADLGPLACAGHARVAADYRHVGPGYRARLAADCRGLHVAGLTAAPIDRDLVRLDGTANGPRLDDGRPGGWHSAKVDLKAGDLQVDLAATQEADGLVKFGGLAAGDLPGVDLGRAEVKVAARWRDRVVDCDELRAWLMPPGSPAGDQADPHTLAVAARGRLDLNAGSVALEAIPDVPAGALGLGPGGLKVSGWQGAAGSLIVEAGLIGDLAALDGYLAARAKQPAKGWTGPWSATFKATPSARGETTFDGQLAAADLVGQGPVTLAARGSYVPATARLDLAAADLTTKYAKVSSRLTLDKVTSSRDLAWSGTIDPRWDVIGPILAHAVEPGARVDAKPRPFHLAGSLAGESVDIILPHLAGEFGLDIASATAFGVTTGPMPVVLKVAGGKMAFDPIATTVNGGPTLIQSALKLDADHGLWFRLDESRVDGAAINDAVSSSVLAFVAPVLSRATEVSGKLTVVIGPDGAEFPLTANGTTRVQGIIAFNDVVCRPGPLANQVFAITGQAAPKLAFAEPVRFAILDGRVQQSGLSIPLGGGSQVDFAGSVGFDKTLQVKATVPITAAMVGRDADLAKLLGGVKINIPIGGTLTRPAIDRRGLQDATRDAIRTVAGRGLKDQAGKLIERVAGARLPTDPSATGTGGAAADPKRDLIRGLLEGLGKDAGESKP